MKTYPSELHSLEDNLEPLSAEAARAMLQELHEKEERLALATLHNGVGIWDLNLITQELVWDDSMFALYHIHREDFSGTKEAWSACLHPDDYERANREVNDAICGIKPLDTEFRVVWPNGEIHNIKAVAKVFHDDEGKPVRMLGTNWDITALKTAVAALRETSQKLNLHFEQTIMAAIEWDLDFRIKRWNPAAQTTFGYTQNEALGQHASFIVPEAFAHHVNEVWQALLNQTGGQKSINENVRKDGHIILCEWYNTLLIDELGKATGCVSLALDITERHQAQIERDNIERKMQETQKLESLGVLAGGIAHDFNNLLTGILGNASMANTEIPAASPLHTHLDSIKEASLRAADLCKQMLAYSGRGRFMVQHININQLVEETAQMLKISISKKAILHFHLENDLPPVDADATQIRQVIMNLVINASEAIGENSGVIALTTGVIHLERAYFDNTLLAPALPEGDYVFLEVADSGSGMSAETKARIFDPFFTTKFTGRGLGLAAVLGIVRGHKGAIKVDSEIGRGTTFRLLFPATGGTSESPKSTPNVTERWQGHGTVLVVDDEEPVRSISARMLALSGFEPVLAADGQEAVDVFSADPDRFTLVLLDLTMPHMGGDETFRELQKLRADVPVVLMSGYNQQDVLGNFPGSDLISFLQKPFTLEDLRAVLRSVLC